MPLMAQTNNVSLYLPVETFAISPKGVITGVISLKIGEYYFPAREWNDFPVRLLKLWLDEILELWHGQGKDDNGIACVFMDGDFYFSVSEHRANRWLVEGIKDYYEQKVVCESEVDRSAFVKDVLLNASTAVRACISKGWKSKDLSDLAMTVAKVEKETDHFDRVGG